MGSNKERTEEKGMFQYTRREVLYVFAGMGTAVALNGIGWSRPGGILKRPIPRGGEHVPAVGLGTSRTFEVGTGAGERKDVKAVLRLFVEKGGSLVDSSPMYGPAERVVGDLAAELGVQEKLFYATKVWIRGQGKGIAQMEESMKRMRRKQLDLIQVHNLVDWETQLKTLFEWKEMGRVRYVGITHYQTSAFDDLARIMKTEPLDFVQFNYSIATREAERRLLPLAKERRIAVLVNRPFKRGKLFRRVKGKPLPGWAAEFDCKSWAQYFLKYILSHPDVTCVIPATSNSKHLIDNMQAGYGHLPDEEMRKKMVEFFETI